MRDLSLCKTRVFVNNVVEIQESTQKNRIEISW